MTAGWWGGRVRGLAIRAALLGVPESSAAPYPADGRVEHLYEGNAGGCFHLRHTPGHGSRDAGGGSRRGRRSASSSVLAPGWPIPLRRLTFRLGPRRIGQVCQGDRPCARPSTSPSPPASRRPARRRSPPRARFRARESTPGVTRASIAGSRLDRPRPHVAAARRGAMTAGRTDPPDWARVDAACRPPCECTGGVTNG
jgi:hypothetical protein